MGIICAGLAVVAIVLGMIFVHKKWLAVIVCERKEGAGQLTGQLRAGPSTAYLPNRPGLNKYTIDIDAGRLRLNHAAYNPDGGAWSLPPGGGKPAFYELNAAGTYTFFIHIGEQFGERDKLQLVNANWRKHIHFRYRCENID